MHLINVWGMINTIGHTIGDITLVLNALGIKFTFCF